MGASFVFSSGSSTGSLSALSASPSVSVASSDAVGKVVVVGQVNSTLTKDAEAPTGTGNVVIAEGLAAGNSHTINFYYTLGAGRQEYIKDGELEILVPSGWTAPIADNVAVSLVAYDGTTAVPDAANATAVATW